MKDTDILKAFKCRMYIKISLLVFTLMGIYNLFIYFAAPQIINISLVASVIFYILTFFPAMIIMNKRLNSDSIFRQKTLEKASKPIKEK